MELLHDIYQVCFFPLILVLAGYLISWLRSEKEQALARIESEQGDRYAAQIFDTISACVGATTQTYVQSLKAQGKFDKEAQQQAFKDTYTAVLKLLTEEAKEYIAMAYGDIQAYLTAKIEAEVLAQK